MSKRSAKERLERDSEPILEEIDSPAIKREKARKPPTGAGKKPKKEPVNWSGILLLALFCIPAIVGAFIAVQDYIYPEEAKMRKIRQPLEKCYHAANPDKISEIDYIMKKYHGREQKLFAQLRAKYGQQHHECEIWPPH